MPGEHLCLISAEVAKLIVRVFIPGVVGWKFGHHFNRSQSFLLWQEFVIDLRLGRRH